MRTFINKNIINRKEILMEYVTLNNEVRMPQLGYGLYLIDNAEAARCTRDALETGYRLIDTAQMYGNESGVGEGIRESGVDRQDIFLVSKIGLLTMATRKLRHVLTRALNFSRPTISTSCCCISPLATPTALTVLWRMLTARVRSVPSA